MSGILGNNRNLRWTSWPNCLSYIQCKVDTSWRATRGKGFFTLTPYHNPGIHTWLLGFTPAVSEMQIWAAHVIQLRPATRLGFDLHWPPRPNCFPGHCPPARKCPTPLSHPPATLSHPFCHLALSNTNLSVQGLDRASGSQSGPVPVLLIVRWHKNALPHFHNSWKAA